MAYRFLVFPSPNACKEFSPERNSILFLVGPTGAGKSKVALHLAKALNAEIISADSMQIYRGMNIGTAKPTPAEQKKIRHHLIDIVSPQQSFSVHEFRKRALRAIGEIIRRGKLPLVVGGSGLYLRSLLRGLSFLPGKNDSIRKRLEKEAESGGVSSLYERLLRLDPQRARGIHPRHERRIIRSLEILEQSNRRVSECSEQPIGLADLGFQPVVVGLTRPRPQLYDEINQRVDKMFRRGWIAEVRRLGTIKLSETSAQAIGYREIRQYLADAMNFEQTRNLIKRNTRRFAKRQTTWFRQESGIHWFLWRGRENARQMASRVLSKMRYLGRLGAGLGLKYHPV